MFVSSDTIHKDGMQTFKTDRVWLFMNSPDSIFFTTFTWFLLTFVPNSLTDLIFHKPMQTFSGNYRNQPTTKNKDKVFSDLAALALLSRVQNKT